MVKNKEIKELLEILSEGGWEHASIVTEEFTLTLGNGAGATSPTHVSATAVSSLPESSPVAPIAGPRAGESVPAQAVPSPAAGELVAAPSVGVAWRSPKPGAPPFVAVGQTVKVGDTLVLLEVMKLFTPVQTELAGRVTAIHVNDGDMVEFGSALVTIERV